MRKTTTIALVATLVGLAGCSTFDEKPVPLTNSGAGTVIATPAPVALAPVPVTVIAIEEPTKTAVNGQFIDAAAVLDKLDEIGCKLSDLEIRVVKRGGHFSAKCIVTDPLNANLEDL